MKFIVKHHNFFDRLPMGSFACRIGSEFNADSCNNLEFDRDNYHEAYWETEKFFHKVK